MITISNLRFPMAWAISVLVSLVLAGGSARAQSTKAAARSTERAQLDEPVPEENRPEDRPWTIGVSQEQQDRAKALYQDGNRFLANSLFAAAVTKYQAALQYWNHPGIHYNLALALISLDHPVEAYEAIVAALRYGPDALHPDEYRRALDYERMLRRQLADVEVICREPGATVTLDGKPLFTGPGQITTLVLPGQHQIVASKPRYITASRVFTVAGRARIELQPLPERRATMQIRRWPARTQWAVTGVGLGIGATAAVLHWQSDLNARLRDDLLEEHCTAGCEPTPEMRALEGRIQWQRYSAYAGYATAGAVLAAGALLAYLNRPQTVENRALRDTVRISLSPEGPEGSPGVSINVRF